MGGRSIFVLAFVPASFVFCPEEAQSTTVCLGGSSRGACFVFVNVPLV